MGNKKYLIEDYDVTLKRIERLELIEIKAKEYVKISNEDHTMKGRIKMMELFHELDELLN